MKHLLIIEKVGEWSDNEYFIFNNQLDVKDFLSEYKNIIGDLPNSIEDGKYKIFCDNRFGVRTEFVAFWGTMQ